MKLQNFFDNVSNEIYQGSLGLLQIIKKLEQFDRVSINSFNIVNCRWLIGLKSNY